MILDDDAVSSHFVVRHDELHHDAASSHIVLRHAASSYIVLRDSG